MRNIILAGATFLLAVSSFAQQKVALVQQGKLWGVIDQDGKVIVEPKYTHVSEFVNWMAVVRQGKLYGAVNLKGEEVVKPEYQKVYDFSEEGIARAAIGEYYVESHGLTKEDIGKFLFLDSKGNIITKKLYKKLH